MQLRPAPLWGECVGVGWCRDMSMVCEKGRVKGVFWLKQVVPDRLKLQGLKDTQPILKDLSNPSVWPTVSLCAPCNTTTTTTTFPLHLHFTCLTPIMLLMHSDWPIKQKQKNKNTNKKVHNNTHFVRATGGPAYSIKRSTRQNKHLLYFMHAIYSNRPAFRYFFKCIVVHVFRFIFLAFCAACASLQSKSKNFAHLFQMKCLPQPIVQSRFWLLQYYAPRACKVVSLPIKPCDLFGQSFWWLSDLINLF